MYNDKPIIHNFVLAAHSDFRDFRRIICNLRKSETYEKTIKNC